jgi:hypothetical protein
MSQWKVVPRVATLKMRLALGRFEDIEAPQRAWEAAYDAAPEPPDREAQVAEVMRQIEALLGPGLVSWWLRDALAKLESAIRRLAGLTK